MKTFMIFALASFLATPALAADLPPASPAPPAVSAPPTWAGFYVGIQGGLAQNYSTFNDLDTAQTISKNDPVASTGGLFGGNIGYNWQDRGFVWGFETDINWVSAKAVQTWTCPNCYVVNAPALTTSATLSSNIQWLGSIRARAGLDFDSTLFYLTGGLAYAGVKSTFTFTNGSGDNIGIPATLNNNVFTENKMQLGWTAGVGIEHLFVGNWTGRAEVRYTDLGIDTVTCAGTSAHSTCLTPGYRGQFSTQLWTAAVGVGYQF